MRRAPSIQDPGQILQQGLARRGRLAVPDARRRSDRLDLVQLEFVRHFFNQLGSDRPLLIDVGVDQRMFT